MNWNDVEKMNDDELEEDYEDDEDCQFIDPNELNIIDDTQNWHPSSKYIMSYAKQLGFDPDKDPKEIINIAEKYLCYPLPDNIKRAFMKTNFQILYIDMTTQEIKLRTEIEEKAIEEFEKIRAQFNKKNKKTEDEGKNIKNDLKKKTDDELKKKLEEQKKFMEKEKEIFRDDKVLNLNLDSEEEVEKQDDTNDEIHLEDNTNELRINNNKNDKNVKDDKDNEIEDEDEDDKKRNKNKINIKNMKNDKKNNNNKRYKEIGGDDCFNIDDKSSVNESINGNNGNGSTKYMKNNKKELDLQSKEEENDNEENNIVDRINNLKNSKNSNLLEKNYNSLKSSQEKKEPKHEFILNLNDSNESSENINKNTKKEKDKGKDKDLTKIRKNNMGDNRKKKDYLNKLKRELKAYKTKLINFYNDDKQNYLKKNNVLKNSINKVKSDKKKELDEDLKIYEQSLKDKMSEEINEYRQDYVSNYDCNSLKNSQNNENDFLTRKKKLEINKNEIESNIRIQKERNKNKKESKIEKIKKMKDEKKSEILEEKSRISLKNKTKMDDLEKEFQKKYEKKIGEIKIKLNKEYYKDIDMAKSVKSGNEIQKYINELKEQFEEEELKIKLDCEQKLLNDIDIYKMNIKKKRDEDIKNINENINNLENNYYKDLEIIKKSFNDRKNKEDVQMKKKIQDFTGIFEKFKETHINNVNNEIKEIIGHINDHIYKNINNELKNKDNNINNNNNNYNQGNEDVENKIEEFLKDRISNKKLKINEMQSLIDLTENDYKNAQLKIEFVSQSLLLICRLINGNSSSLFDFEIDDINAYKNKDDTLVSDISQKLENKYHEFQMKFENDNKNRLYSFLNNELKKLLDILNKIDNQNMYNYLLYSNNIKPINNNNNYNNNLNLKSKNNDMIKTNTHRTDFSSNINYDRNNIMNNLLSTNLNSYNKNYNLNSASFRAPLNIDTKRSYNYFNNKLIIPESNRYQNINNNPNIEQNGLSTNNYINEKSERDINKLISNENVNTVRSSIYQPNGDNIPELPVEILNSFSPELLSAYNSIEDFLIQETNKINDEIKELDKKRETNNKLEELKNSGELEQYNDLFNHIFTNEKENSNKTKKIIEGRLKILNMIKIHCDETFNFICNNLTRQDIFKSKLDLLLININNYNNYYKNNRNDSFLSDSFNLNRNRIDNNYSRNNILSNRSNNYNYNIDSNYYRSNNYNNNNNSINDNPIMFKNYNQIKGSVDRYNYNNNP